MNKKAPAGREESSGHEFNAAETEPHEVAVKAGVTCDVIGWRSLEPT